MPYDIDLGKTILEIQKTQALLTRLEQHMTRRYTMLGLEAGSVERDSRLDELTMLLRVVQNEPYKR